ncbi:BnaC06g03180D [Brassica napus]|uniref:BnaC06g03180D protein n=1 Tax=Brassica napus TaxID=3708 RepID=A0A078GSM4_BRANA|nr:BnaC06g03180D [Brassica napus]
MYPCTFIRIIVGNLAVRFPASSSSGPSVSDAASVNWYCKIKFKSFTRQTVSVPVPLRTRSESEPRWCSGDVSTVAACFTLSKAQIEWSLEKAKRSVLSVEAYHGWAELGFNSKSKEVKKSGSDPELHVSVRVEPDPRFVFEFDGEPECSPQVFLVKGNDKQAVFTSKFGLRNSGDRNLSRLSSLTAGNEHNLTERKGWSVTIHDLSGSPVAMASMVTPFVPSPGSNHVSRSSPGAWLILRPDGYTMKPWGRLEAWREPGISDFLGYRFERFQDNIATVISSSSSISTKLGGSFAIDGTITTAATVTAASLTLSDGSFDLSSGLSTRSSRTGSECGSDFGFLQPQAQHNFGFVMSTTVEGVEKQSKPKVEVGVKHVTCLEDAAAHVALAAAVDLSMDACRLFTHKIRKELRQPSSVGVV